MLLFLIYLFLFKHTGFYHKSQSFVDHFCIYTTDDHKRDLQRGRESNRGLPIQQANALLCERTVSELRRTLI